MYEFVSAALRGHMPQAGILPLALLLLIVGSLALGLRLSTWRESRTLAARRVSSSSESHAGARR